jgi:hypothetical protein
MTAEKAAAEIGLGALFGGVLMGGGKAAGEGIGAIIGKARDALESVATKVAKGDEATVSFMFKHRGTLEGMEQAVPGTKTIIESAPLPNAQYIVANRTKIAELEKGFPGLTEILGRADPATADSIVQNWGKLLKDPQARIEVGLAQGKALQGAYTTVEDALRVANRDVRPAEIARLAAKVDPQAAGAEYGRIFDAVDELAAKMRKEPELFPAMYPKKLEAIRDGMVRDVGDLTDQAQVFTSINDVRKVVDQLAKFGKLIPPEHRDAAVAIKGLRGMISDSLENTKVWGEAGARQEAFQAAQSAFLRAKEKLEKTLMQKVTTRTGAVTFEVAPTKVNSWINLMADARGQAKSQVFDEYLTAARELAGEMEKSGFADAGAVRKVIEGAAAQSNEVRQRGSVTQLVKMLQGHEILSSGPAVPMSSQGVMSAAAQSAASHLVPSGVISGVTEGVAKLRSPAMMTGVLSALDDLAKATTKGIAGGVARIFGGVAEAEAAAGAAETAAKVTRENFRHVAGTLGDLGANLDRVAEITGQETGPLQPHAPAASEALVALAARGLGHLGASVPKGPPKLALDAEYVPSPTELAHFNRVVSIAQRPTAALEHIARGTYTQEHHQALQVIYPKLAHFNRVVSIAQRPTAALEHIARGTYTQEHHQALQVIYPKLAEEMKLQVLDHLSKEMAKGNRLPRRIRLGLGTFLGVDLDSSMTPAAIAAAQQAYALAPLQEGAAGPGPAPKLRASVKTRLGEGLATSAQGIEQRLGKA